MNTASKYHVLLLKFTYSHLPYCIGTQVVAAVKEIIPLYTTVIVKYYYHLPVLVNNALFALPIENIWLPS